MALSAAQFKINLPDRELACAPLTSPLGKQYLGAMRAAINCALANRQIIAPLTRQAVDKVFPVLQLGLLYDVSPKICKLEQHTIKGRKKALYIHRKGATRAFAPGHPDLPADFKETGQPVLIGVSMGTRSYVLCGTKAGKHRSFSSACPGAGRAMSRSQATKQWQGKTLVEELAAQGISSRGKTIQFALPPK